MKNTMLNLLAGIASSVVQIHRKIFRPQFKGKLRGAFRRPYGRKAAQQFRVMRKRLGIAAA